MKKVTEELETLREFTESMVEVVQDGLISIDKKGKITYFNKSAEDILGYRKEKVIGMDLKEIFSPDDYNYIVSSKFRAGEVSVGKETNAKKENGEEISIGFSTAALSDDAGGLGGHIITFKDLTEIHRMQEEILRMDRLSSLGEISSGIAHEIRNPLAAIKTTAQAMEEEIDESDPKREFLSRIVKEIDRLDLMLRTFFSFARPKRPELTNCDIREVIREVLLLLNKDINNNKIKVVEKYDDNPFSVYADFSQLQQVFLNLFLNAIIFMEESKERKIVISVKNKKEKKEEFLEIILEDTGIGIDEEHINKIFDPFFTTRARGVGLGLSITYRIVTKHGGNIVVHSKKGEGAKFVITLPAMA
ncbi:MAG: PAS domain S-box protein [Deltaproteobacteria bacterium]|uniref:histidine kinase n=1 Tax=Candidatus Zymogenus saltonus TaxID=2844893 RepID=A0A9D8PKQ4_9DELT|nr:PAS domain S-box protein [Candidatus Zymogenus saltonus]